MTLIELDFEVTHPLTLNPWPVAALRGILGQHLRGCCLTGGACSEEAACPYCTLFEAPPEPPIGPKRFYTPPRPFVIQTRNPGHPLPRRRGDHFSIRIKLFGRGRYFAEAVTEAFDHLEISGGRARLVERMVIDPSGEARPWAPQHLRAAWLLDPTPTEAEPRALKLTLTTPLSVQHHRQLMQRFDPEMFTARAIDRLECLAFYYEGIAADWDIHALRAEARGLRVNAETALVRYQRNSRRHDHRQTMEGIIGEVHIEGVTPALAALWRCAQDTHVGRDTVFGHGALRVDLA
ncbi:CRISPR system precrRNA processing endoribonuclease RAMP protein Cas6 [Myxococcota bacterium]|nr:CRISPR system precrRNA processing endoribonuclease RAMP protein Cas6 [Myxococcota bacterium]